ncbi:hypothetical protein ACF1G4_03385 [Streptomyces caelestis]
MTDTTAARAALRARIAEAALHAVETALGDTLLPAAREEALAGIVAVLPAPADRAAVLRAEADRIDATREDFPIAVRNGITWATAELRRHAAECPQCGTTGACNGGPCPLRRLADETQPAEPRPSRGDAFEQWLKARRDEWAPDGCQPWQILDQVLEEYRLHAATGTPLSEHVCEGQAVGDCECLEQPAAGARQDGAQR